MAKCSAVLFLLQNRTKCIIWLCFIDIYHFLCYLKKEVFVRHLQSLLIKPKRSEHKWQNLKCLMSFASFRFKAVNEYGTTVKI